jgi:hypothetical protein
MELLDTKISEIKEEIINLVEVNRQEHESSKNLTILVNEYQQLTLEDRRGRN